MPRGKFSDWINEYRDWLMPPPPGAGTDKLEDMWCGACNCIVKKKKYNAETHMKTVKHMRAMGLITNEDKKMNLFGNSDEYMIINQSSEIGDPFYDTISTVDDCIDSIPTTVTFKKQQSSEPHITYLTAPDIKKEKKSKGSPYYAVFPGQTTSTNFFPTTTTKKLPDEDDFFVFGKHVANELRAVEDRFSLQTMKMKINTILFEGRTGQYNKVGGVDYEPNSSHEDESPTPYTRQNHASEQASINVQDEDTFVTVTCPDMPTIT